MNPRKLVQSIYLGDRGCTAFVFDDQKKQLRIQVDCISLLRPGSQKWDYYSERDIENGWIVFSGVDTFKMQPQNVEPNDFINEIAVENDTDQNGQHQINISISSVDTAGNSTEVIISARVSDAHLEDCNRLPITLE